MARAGPLVLARFASAVITVCIPLVLARVLSLHDYGTYKWLFLVAQLLYFTLPFGVPQSLFFFLPRAGERRPFIGHSLLFMAGMGVLAAAGVAALGGVLARAFNNPDLAVHAPALALYTGALLASNGFEVSLTSRGQTRTAAAVYLVSDVSRAALMVLPVVWGWDLRQMMWGVAFWAVCRLLFAWVMCLQGEAGPLFDRAVLRRQLAYAAPFGVAMLFAIPQQYAHQFVVSGMVSPELFAIYTVGCFQLPLVDLLYTPTSEVLMVRLGELDREGRPGEGAAAFRDAVTRLAYAFLPLSAFLFTAAPEFITALFGARFEAAVPLFRVCVLSICLAVLPLDGVLRARGATKAILASYVVKALVTVPLVWVGVTHYGLLGGIGSWAIAELVGKATLFVRVPRALGAPGRPARLGELLPWGALLRAAGAAVGAAGAVVLLRAAAPHAWEGLPEGFVFRLLPLAAVGASFALGYLAVLRLVGVRPLAMLSVLRRRGG
jgi:O-antigen/teichoic acid export membrane protein